MHAPLDVSPDNACEHLSPTEDLAPLRLEILKACSDGDITALRALFKKLDIGGGKPFSRSTGDWNYSDERVCVRKRMPDAHEMKERAASEGQSDTLAFLCTEFPDDGWDYLLIEHAVMSGDVETVRLVCRLSPRAAKFSTSMMRPLEIAPSRATAQAAVEIIKVLLDNGADPNEQSEHLPWCTCASRSIMHGLPVIVFEYLFDVGWICNDAWVFHEALKNKRADVLEIMFNRGKDQSAAVFPSQTYLIKEAEGDKDLIGFIEGTYPTRFKTPSEQTAKRGLLYGLVQKVVQLGLRSSSTGSNQSVAGVGKKPDPLMDSDSDHEPH